MSKEKIIGFVGNWWGTPKGHSYVTRDLLRILDDEGYEIHMFRCGNNPIPEEFPMPHNGTIEGYNDRIIPKEAFEKWLDEKKPDYCIFNEYTQWWNEDHDKINICKEKGIKTIGYLVWEKLDWDKRDHYNSYWKIIAPSEFQTKLMRSKGVYNVVHIPWGVDIDEMNAVPMRDRTEDRLIRFFHCAGSGGVGDRKNTDEVIKAYGLIKDERTELVITHLGSKVFSRKEIISFMKSSDVLINATKWETIGLNTIEANACGIPAIVSNTPPMNELITNNVNGLLVNGKEVRSEQVSCPAFHIDVEDLAKKMEMCKNKLILDTLKNSARVTAERKFNWKYNKKPFLKLFEDDKK